MKYIRFIAAALIAVMLLPAAVFAAERNGLENFTENREYLGQFTDVKRRDWFYKDVAGAFRLGLMNGTDDTTFNPNGEIRLCEAIVVAARLHSIYYTGSDEFETSSPWYDTYVDYAKKNNIIRTDYADYDEATTRAQFAMMLAAALPPAAFEEINEVCDGGIPDITMAHPSANAVYKLYRAGIVIGNDKLGTFEPETKVKRCEVAAILSRVVNKTARQKFTSDVVYEREYNENGVLCALHACKYNEYGDLTEKTTYTTDGVATVYEEYGYNKYGMIASESSYGLGGEFLYHYEHEYDKNGRLIITTVYDEDGSVDYYKEYRYNYAGQCIRETTYSADGKMVGCYEYKYGVNGVLINIFTHDKDGHVISSNPAARP